MSQNIVNFEPFKFVSGYDRGVDGFFLNVWDDRNCHLFNSLKIGISELDTDLLLEVFNGFGCILEDRFEFDLSNAVDGNDYRFKSRFLESSIFENFVEVSLPISEYLVKIALKNNGLYVFEVHDSSDVIFSSAYFFDLVMDFETLVKISLGFGLCISREFEDLDFDSLVTFEGFFKI